MALYLKPPRGMIDFYHLQKCVEERLKFFENMTSLSLSAHNMEYLFEDSAFDRAGHFTLRLAAIKEPTFLTYFINSEIKLLKLRLTTYKSDLITRFLKNQLRHARECIREGGCNEKILALLNVLSSVLTRMLIRRYRNHVFNEEHISNDKCKIFTLNVSFQHFPSLISRREFILKKGDIQIPCEKWKDLFISFFYTYLRAAINEMRYSRNVQIALEDERIKSIISSVCLQENRTTNSIALSHINTESKFFPPCMQHLQDVLQKKHRLAHEERINLSLFLKDVGVSLVDSITYWKMEYSKETNCTNCSHNWQQNEKRYTYSLRHLYGLEGSRRTYKTRSCSYFQNMIVSPMQEGGCPFKHFDDKNLKALLSKSLNGDRKNINNVLLEKQSPSIACNLFLKIVKDDAEENSMSDDSIASSSSSGCDICFNNPVQYFFLMKNALTK